MSKPAARAKIKKVGSRRTNKDRPRRRYRLSPNGLKSLRAAAMKNKPWLLSCGPKTAAGKARSKLNATKHGERSAGSRSAWRELNAALRTLAQHDHARRDSLNTSLDDGGRVPGGIWVPRIAAELGLSPMERAE